MREESAASAAPFYDDAVRLLHRLSGVHGIRASESGGANYGAVFARDAVMAGVAGLLIEDQTITNGLVRTLEHLRDLQGREGQVASNYELRAGEPARVSFGTIVPRIDSATWYLLGIALGARARVLDPAPFRSSVHSVIRLLAAIEYNGRHLMYVPPGGNWADEYVTEGYVLYDQVLRAWALRLLGTVYDERLWLEKASQIERTIEINYWPTTAGEQRGTPFHSPSVRTLIDPHRRYPAASFSPLGGRNTFDLAACSLLAVSGIVPPWGSASLEWIAERFLDRSELPPAFHPVIDESHPDWPALRQYFLYEFRNRPHEYHNGGIWPIWLGWLALALACTDRIAALEQLRHVIRSRLDGLPEFRFEEYLHGTTGLPGGMAGMAYSATGLVFLHAASSPERLTLLTR